MAEVPAVCPHCGCREIEVQVIAWWTYSEGKPACQGDDYIELASDPMPHCSRCSKEVEMIDG